MAQGEEIYKRARNSKIINIIISALFLEEGAIFYSHLEKLKVKAAIESAISELYMYLWLIKVNEITLLSN